MEPYSQSLSNLRSVILMNYGVGLWIEALQVTIGLPDRFLSPRHKPTTFIRGRQFHGRLSSLKESSAVEQACQYLCFYLFSGQTAVILNILHRLCTSLFATDRIAESKELREKKR